ncbi:MAG: acyl-CoA thioesterase [Candidatus Marinimicrobia bacterium]|jgi:acyl-CoA hydrolase|nr:acyl-CoA thioesterase [Candidatus Neomarinimicrobiota bacterium]MDP6500433.1 acyl-CoA thioesterase [Candidatus Neomarinimicrobiota bacterium]MDP6726647.1 acyl-CoA thioesterase [Candidatus Neomarinimicrobiota bacterium]|tara:strand:- start:13484 stop:13882 length:399 start_codon:yes stop_codon:yes gene_type:complete
MKYTAKYSQIVMPDNINIIGTLFGGQMVSWMDLAAAKVTYRFLEGTAANGAVTRAIEKVEFKEPVYKGEWVNFESTVINTGKSSFQVKVEAYAEGRERGKRLACTALITMVSVCTDKNGEYHKFEHGKSCEE